MHIGSTTLWKIFQEYTKGKGYSLNGVGKTGYPHAKEWNWMLILHTAQKPAQNGLKN